MKDEIILQLFLWLFLAVILIQIMLGGITRLTGSGLSITKWQIITGVLPPLNENQWTLAFDQYKASPQYKLINEGMAIPAFKNIYFWEWIHRNWGRLGMLLLFSGFVYFILIRRMGNPWRKAFIGLLLMYALQGVVGWYMVVSGLSEMPYVSHFRLAMHLLMALLLLGFVVWLLVRLLISKDQKTTPYVWKFWTFSTMLLTLLQIIYGAFMSGLRAALEFPTWPLMNGSYLPQNLWVKSYSFGYNLFSHKPMVQFIHRHLGYAVALAVFFLVIKIAKDKTPKPRILMQTLWFLPAMVILQVILGIATLLLSARGIPVWLGSLHQLGGLLLFNGLLFLFFLLRRAEKEKLEFL